MKWCFSLAVLLSSFLLLGVQPMLAKVLLPLVGGAAGVWTASMLFFQLLLLAGYGYAALSSRFLTPLKQSALHVVLCLIAAACYTPLALQSANTEQLTPELWIVATLFLTIGLPYFLLSANSSMLQRWYFATYNREPYHLFSASNIGSFVGLFAYPFFVEWHYNIPQQLSYWSYGFFGMALLLALFPACLKQSSASHEVAQNLPKNAIAAVVFLAFIPSSLFLSTTLHVTSDIGAFPLLWVIPLALYLFSFVVVFAPWGARWITLAQALHPMALLLLCVSDWMSNHSLAITSSFLFFFVIAVSCHGALAQKKPKPQQLTMYFFWVSVGGALGGAGNLLAQYVFNNLYEYPIVLVLSAFALPGKRKLWERIKRQKMSAFIAFIVANIFGLCFYLNSHADVSRKTILTERNFYGVSRVSRDLYFTYFEHGTTLHGLQANSGNTLHLTSYYTPVDALFSKMPKSFFNKPIGAVGMGVGTIACVARHGVDIDFFEINPQVVAIAENPNYFTYLSKCLPKAHIINGDGRLAIAKQPDAKYGAIVLDAFSSDSVPIHLLTREAFNIYTKKLAANGLILINVSSRYLELTPFIANVAKNVGLTTYRLEHHPLDAQKKLGEKGSIWLALLPENSKLEGIVKKLGYQPVVVDTKTPLWTDDYSNIVPAIIW